MQGNKPNILFTRAVAQGLIDKANANDILLSAIPFIKTVALPANEIRNAVDRLKADDTIVFTSTNAVNAVAAVNKELQCKVYCISGATCDAVKKQLSNCTIAGVADDAMALANEIVKEKTVKAMSFFCGDIHLPDLPRTLGENNIVVDVQVVYTTELTPQKADGKYDAITFFSPSAVKSYLSANTIEEDIILFAIGKATAESLNSLKNEIITSTAPNADAMLDTIINFYKGVYTPGN